jgi:hypothetical protein
MLSSHARPVGSPRSSRCAAMTRFTSQARSLPAKSSRSSAGTKTSGTRPHEAGARSPPPTDAGATRAARGQDPVRGRVAETCRKPAPPRPHGCPSAALIGAAAALAVVVANGIEQRWLEARRQRDELVAAAITDVFLALAQSAHGKRQQGSELFSQAKARLASYRSREVIDALLAFQRAGDRTLAPDGRAAIAELVRCARAALGNKDPMPPDDVLRLLFGSGDAGGSSACDERLGGDHPRPSAETSTTA